MKYLSGTSTSPANLLQKMSVIVATTVLGGLTVMFSAIFLVVILSLVATAWIVLLWKTRKLRKQMRNDSSYDTSLAHDEFSGKIIEGEVIRVDEPKNMIRD